MRRLSFLPLLVISLILSHAIPRRPSAEIDTRRLSLSSQYADPVAWLNIEGPPFWVGGIEPDYSFDDRTHIVELEPGNEVRLILPTGDSVLVQGPVEESDMLEWSTSNGSGLWSEAVAETTAIPDQMLLPF